MNKMFGFIKKMFIEAIGFIILNGYDMINAIILLKCVSMCNR